MLNNNYYFNGSPIVAPLVIQSNEPAFSTDTLSLKHYRTSQNAQRWELSFMVRSANDARKDLVSRIVNNSTPRTMVMPQLNDVVTNSLLPYTPITISANAAANAYSLTASFPVGTKLSQGYFIKFSNHNKIYMIVADVENPASIAITGTPQIGNSLSVNITNASPVQINGNPIVGSPLSLSVNAPATRTIDIYPSLRQAVPSGTQVLVGNEVLFRYLMKNTTMRGIVYEDGILADAGAIELFEAL
jgi:hypothetical protein